MIKKWIIALIVALTMSISNVSAASYYIKASNVYRGRTATFKINKIKKGDYVTVKIGSKKRKKKFNSKKSKYSYKVKMPSSGSKVVVIHYSKSKKKLIKKTFKLKSKSKKKSSKKTSKKSSIVYITPSGNKYHRKSCATTKRSKKLTKISKSKAKARGYKACKVCKP
ncbi:MAG: hypothetical protein J6P61_08565 [Erysipelotrichaceae bacterium]|nr:hypothetical protein [Erysipelotrichaceae bacterium]